MPERARLDHRAEGPNDPLLASAGRLAARLTGDPVLASFLELAGGAIPADALVTLLAWRLGMAAGSTAARSPALARLLIRHPILHRLNARVDAAAQAVASSPLEDDAARRRWCRVLGIDPEVDLTESLSTFRTLNELFTHAPGPGTRPVEAPDDPAIVTAPCDGSYAFFPSTERLRSFVSKESHFELGAVLGRASAELGESFRGGAAAYVWLSLVDNHRWYAPIAGRVLHADREVAQTHGRLGLFLEARYLEANTRGVFVFEAPSGLRVAFVPIGLSPINSISISVRPGERVEKGDPLGTFEIGGSAALVLFDRRARVELHDEGAGFDGAEALLNLNYMEAKNRARRRIGRAIATVRSGPPDVGRSTA